jgi:SET domain
MLGYGFGLLAAALQVVGYIFYIRRFVKNTIRPNAASWLMFAYGTALLTMLEYANGALWPVLALPVVCAVMSVAVAGMCMRKDATDPVDRVEQLVLSADVILTIAFAAATLGVALTSLPHSVFLILGNVTTFTAFIPILRSTWAAPKRETAGPWLAWSLAYFALALATLWSDHLNNPQLLIYPVMSVILHGAVAGLSWVGRERGRLYCDAARSIYIQTSEIEGKGIFANAAFGYNAQICVLTGRPMRGPVSPNDGPNWIGIGRNAWIDPDMPLDHINHSCAPNAAFSPGYILRALRPISPGEEITLDYSTTEADPFWTMECACMDDSCRGTVRAIQIDFADQDFPPPAAPALQRVWSEDRPTRDAEKRSAFPQMTGTDGSVVEIRSIGNREIAEN